MLSLSIFVKGAGHRALFKVHNEVGGIERSGIREIAPPEGEAPRVGELTGNDAPCSIESKSRQSRSGKRFPLRMERFSEMSDEWGGAVESSFRTPYGASELVH